MSVSRQSNPLIKTNWTFIFRCCFCCHHFVVITIKLLRSSQILVSAFDSLLDRVAQLDRAWAYEARGCEFVFCIRNLKKFDARRPLLPCVHLDETTLDSIDSMTTKKTDYRYIPIVLPHMSLLFFLLHRILCRIDCCQIDSHGFAAPALPILLWFLWLLLLLLLLL